MAPKTMSRFTATFLLVSLSEQAEGHSAQPHTIKRFQCRGVGVLTKTVRGNDGG
jgi:hypothetical protein